MVISKESQNDKLTVAIEIKLDFTYLNNIGNVNILYVEKYFYGIKKNG